MPCLGMGEEAGAGKRFPVLPRVGAPEREGEKILFSCYIGRNSEKMAGRVKTPEERWRPSLKR
ncbi:MAG: hypothetical protein VST70_03155 [Nitrospirota bacterium]|nr:hypothetical protein [Nitrospirota bacterium]